VLYGCVNLSDPVLAFARRWLEGKLGRTYGQLAGIIWC
jgi:hypothetical protein